MASYSGRSIDVLWKGNKIRLPTWIKTKDLTELKGDYRRDLWWQLIPYIHEPISKNNRNRLSALQLKRLATLTKNKERSKKRTSSASRRLRVLNRSNHERFERLGGTERLVHAPSRGEFIEQRFENFTSLIETYFIVRTFLRLHIAQQKQDVWPSIERSVKVLSGKGIPAAYNEASKANADLRASQRYQLFDLARKSKNSLVPSWSQFKYSAPLIFGMFEAIFSELATQSLYPPEKPRESDQPSPESYRHAKRNFIKSFDSVCAKNVTEILALTLYAQNMMTSFNIRNTKKPALDPFEVLWLPSIRGLEASTPDLELLAEIEIKAFNA